MRSARTCNVLPPAQVDEPAPLVYFRGMANLATLAPPFTKENAKEMSRRGAEARRIKREREKALLAQAAELARRTANPDTDAARSERVKKQIDALLTDMERTKDTDKRLRIAGALDRLWKLVQPTCAPIKANARSRPAMPVAIPRGPATPQGSGSAPVPAGI